MFIKALQSFAGFFIDRFRFLKGKFGSKMRSSNIWCGTCSFPVRCLSFLVRTQSFLCRNEHFPVQKFGRGLLIGFIMWEMAVGKG